LLSTAQENIGPEVLIFMNRWNAKIEKYYEQIPITEDNLRQKNNEYQELVMSISDTGQYSQPEKILGNNTMIMNNENHFVCVKGERSESLCLLNDFIRSFVRLFITPKYRCKI